MLVYFVFVLGIGFALKRYMRTSNDFFLAGRSIPAWVCGLAFISANLGAQEVIGMGASGAKYGIITSHFYWIGAIPAMIFVGPSTTAPRPAASPNTSVSASTKKPAPSTPSPSPA
jgi:SSS family solute:Na+ symporter